MSLLIQLIGQLHARFAAADRHRSCNSMERLRPVRAGILVSAIILTVVWSQGLPVKATETANSGLIPGRPKSIHPISIVEAHIFVTRTKAVARLQMFAEDLVLFQGLEPDNEDRIPADDLRRGLEDHKEFFLRKFILRDADGNPVPGRITDMKPFEIPNDGIPYGQMMQHTATYEVEFDFPDPPEFLTIQQEITDSNFIIPSELMLTVHQSGSGLNFTERLLPGGTTTLRFDWQQVLSEDATDAEWDSWFEKQREKTLGITSYSSVYSFIYLEPSEIRHELLIPLATLATIIPVDHADPAFVQVEEQASVRETIRGWLKERNPVSINGRRVFPEMTRIDFYSLNLSDFAARSAEQRVSLASGRVGIIMTYRPENDFVRDVSMTWETYYSGMTKVPAVVVAWPDRMDRFEFSRFNTQEDNTLTWSCPEDQIPRPTETVTAELPPRPVLQIPVSLLTAGLVSGFCLLTLRSTTRRIAITVCLLVMIAGWNILHVELPHPWRLPPELNNSEATQIYTDLHQGIYQALNSGTEERIYDSLERTVDGKLLENLYLQLRQSLEIREQGGAVARIRDVTYDSGAVIPRTEASTGWPGFQYHSTWTVAGTVEHWGHIHERQNQFDAVFTIEPRDSGESTGQVWKITRMDIEGQTQKSARTTLRRF